VEAVGTLAFDNPDPMSRDTIFRVASITKPITAVAAMILVEECRLRLDDSIEPWLPELANRRVLKSISSNLDDTVPALRAITVRDLLTYRMGFGSVMAMPDTYPIQKFIREYRIGGDGPILPSQAPGMNEWLQKLGSLPLLAQPGERRCAWSLDRACVRTIPRHVHARAHLRSARNERYSISRASRKDRSLACILFLQSSGEQAGFF
jgi:CubicO group peptidase (beta-lactamase class C family)